MQDSTLASLPPADTVATDTLAAVDSTVALAADVADVPFLFWIKALFILAGAFAFGTVVGWVTYRTIRRSETTGLADIAAVIGAVGGAAVLVLFPAGTALFGAYGIGLAVGFFGYLWKYFKTYGLDAIRTNPGDHNILGQPEHGPPTVPSGRGPANLEP
ncbi:hypothetical protein [Rubrivirga sp. IMCC45206]|uniref:hypothetical protein n=1 Tax=Rubrivirga sp. IMCC45206 TaxID=3391614 RepID=UPI00399022E0